MAYEERIQNNLMNNFVDRREMVEIMLEVINSKLENIVVEKIKMSSYGKELNRVFSEKDYFDFICYSYLFYLEEKTDKKLNDFMKTCNTYLSTFSNIENVTKFEDYGAKYKLALQNKKIID